MSLELYLAFVAATVILILIPGPNVALIVANSVAHGVRYGLLTVAGTSSAVVIQLLLTIAGMTTFLSVMANWFEWLRWIGVAYLIWLGIRAWRAPPVDLTKARPEPRSARAIYLRGFLVSLSNPKTLLFYGAFFPQFVSVECRSHDPARPARGDLSHARGGARRDLGASRRTLSRRARRQRQASQPSHRGPADRGGRGSCAGAPILSADPERGSRNAGLSGQALSCGAPPRPASFPWQLQESRWRSGKRLGRVLLNASAESGFGGKAHIAVTSRSFRL